jgi:AAA domain
VSVAKRRTRPLKYTDLIAELDSVGAERDWFARNAIEGTPLVLWCGPEKTAKSWTAMNLAEATAMGGTWLGEFKVEKPGTVVYLDGEYGGREFARRVARIARAEGHDPRAVLAKLRHYDARGFTLAADDPVARAAAEDMQEVDAALVVVDPLRSVLDGDENSAKDVLEAFRVLALFRQYARCPVLLLHHLNKAGGYSGSRALRTRADLIVEGSDAETPVYTATGRTLRGERIQGPFTVRVEHEDDGDDTVAKSYVRAKFGNDVPRSEAAKRVMAFLQEAGEPQSGQAIRRVLGNGNDRALKRVLGELGSAVKKTADGKWEESTKSFYDRLPTSSAENKH